ncbi:MAG: glycerate kinase [Burkholderiaceae bacterium]
MIIPPLLSRVAVPIIGVIAVFIAYRQYGWSGVAVAASLIVMWMLLHFNRVMHVLKRAANRPVGYVGSAVMFNARLKPGVTLLHVMAMTQSLGEALSAKDQEPEVYRWTDGSESHVTCEFRGGKLVKWELVRPEAEQGTP